MGVTWTCSHWCEKTQGNERGRSGRVKRRREAGRQQGGKNTVDDHFQEENKRHQYSNYAMGGRQRGGGGEKEAGGWRGSGGGGSALTGSVTERENSLPESKQSCHRNKHNWPEIQQQQQQQHTAGTDCGSGPAPGGKKPRAALATNKTFLAGFAGFTLGLGHPCVRGCQVSRSRDV